MTKILKEGAKAPAFKVPNQDGKVLSLKDFKDQPLVLYFYPKDMTSGCTQEAIDFRDAITKLKKKKVVVLGVSLDSPDRHKKFIEKYDLNFDLLSDEDAKVSTAYGVYKEKSMYGRKYMGIERTTFIIDKKGVITKIFPKVKITGHIESVLAELP